MSLTIDHWSFRGNRSADQRAMPAYKARNIDPLERAFVVGGKLDHVASLTGSKKRPEWGSRSPRDQATPVHLDEGLLPKWLRDTPERSRYRSETVTFQRTHYHGAAVSHREVIATAR